MKIGSAVLTQKLRANLHRRKSQARGKAAVLDQTSQEEDNIMDTPIIAQKAPFPVEVKEGKAYFWCACGKSQTQPFCDGSHKGGAFSPIPYKASKDETLFFCGCKHSQAKPFCDGSHKSLKD